MAHLPSRGSCLCGAVRVTAQFPSRWVAHCHCTRRQRAHGAPFVTGAGLDASAVAIHDDAQALRWYVASEGGSRGFCSHCGSPMFFTSERRADELHIARAHFVEPLDREPKAHVYFETHVGWLSLSDELPKVPSRSP